MYENFYLNESQIKKINCESNKILFIYGKQGVGKTYLANEILKDRVITVIDSLFLKNNNNIYDYLMNIITKKNITMMFETSKKKRGIIIDDIHNFHKYDKKIYKSIINVLKANIYDTRIIITCNTKFVMHRSLSNIIFDKIYIDLNNNAFNKIVNIILKNKSLILSEAKKKELINKSNFNLTLFESLIENERENKLKINKIDLFDTQDNLTNKLIGNEFNLEEIIRLFINDKITISLNLLENIFIFTKSIEKITDLYNNYIIADLFDTLLLNYCIEDYYCILSLYKFTLINKMNIPKPLINNSYISKLTIQIYNQKIYNNYENNLSIIFLYLYSYLKNVNKKLIQNKLSYYDKKELDNYIKCFNAIYNYKVNIKKLNKFLLL